MENSDKLRKGLECCKATMRGITVKDCDIDCPYFHEGVFCKNALHKDAHAYIQQLEAGIDHAEKVARECAKSITENLGKLESRLAQVERERDAAVADCSRFPCATCSDKGNGDLCHNCNVRKDTTRTNYEWRGVCEENTKEDEKC